MSINAINENMSEAIVPNINSNSNESKNSNSKKKETLHETFYNLCQSLLRFINRKIVKKYVFPNAAQLPKEKRGLELRANNNWKFYLDEEVSGHEKIIDVFKDDNFLNLLQKMANSLNEVVDYMDLNMRKKNMIEENFQINDKNANKFLKIKSLIDDQLIDKNKVDNSNQEQPKSFSNLYNSISEVMISFLQLPKTMNVTPDNNNNTTNENLNKNDESSIREETVPLFNSELSEKNKKNSSEKKEIDILIKNFRLDKINDLEKSAEKVDKEKKEDIKDENIFLNKKTERDVKAKNNKNKNKRKKTQNKEEMKEDKEYETNEIKNEQINIKANFPPINPLIPILKPKEDNNRIDISKIQLKEKNKENDIDKEIIKELIKSEEGKNSKNSSAESKKEIINIDDLPNNKTTEDIFDSEIKKYFSENKRNKKNKIGIIMKSIIYSLNDNKILEIKKYNDRISGPYLAGSYKTFQDLSSLEYPREIDLIYKYKKMLLNKDAMDFSVKEVLENYLELNIVKSNEIAEDENKITKIEIECNNKKWKNDNNIRFNILFVDTEYEFNEQIIDELILNKKEFLVKFEEEKFKNICLFLRVWRRKNQLFYLIPEVLDELVRKNSGQDKTMLTIIFNVFFDLYKKNTNFYPEGNSDYISKQKILCEKIMTAWYNKENDQKINELNSIIIKTAKEINAQNFEEVFKL